MNRKARLPRSKWRMAGAGWSAVAMLTGCVRETREFVDVRAARTPAGSPATPEPIENRLQVGNLPHFDDDIFEPLGLYYSALLVVNAAAGMHRR